MFKIARPALVFLQIAFLTSCIDKKQPVDEEGWPETFAYGRSATSAEIARLDIDVRPDGRGLPEGSGNAIKGKAIYAAKCAMCHGKSGVEGPYSKLIAPVERIPSLAGEESKVKAIGNYWPYATTLYDYINRAMPFNSPGSLSPNEVYSLTAYLLFANNLIDSTAVIDAISLPGVAMPARQFFVDDDRRGGPEVR